MTDAGSPAKGGSVTDAGGKTGADGSAVDAGGKIGTDGMANTDASGGTGTNLTGTLGDLGAAQPIVSALFISYSGETLIYMSSAPVTCDQLKMSRWLGSVTKGAQVVEVVIKGAPKLGTVSVPLGEVNYAPGGKSSSYEVNAKAGSITFTKAEANGVVEGMVSASYDGGNSIQGTFHAEFCAGGQEY